MSGLFQAGAWASQSQGAFGGVVSTGNGHLTPFGGATASQTQGVSGLARQLAPPPCPQYTTPALCVAAVLLGGLTGGLWLFDYMMSSGGGGNAAHGAFVWLIVGFSLVTAGLAFPAWTAAQTQREKHQAAMERWQEQTGRWNQLFYCGRCDQAFDPVARRYAPAMAMGSLL